ncbi:MAG: putative glycosyltransferase, partial [Friedmanniella sp.]|nr:putative glycosyltransferase [Friedmanniella sp.]
MLEVDQDPLTPGDEAGSMALGSGQRGPCHRSVARTGHAQPHSGVRTRGVRGHMALIETSASARARDGRRTTPTEAADARGDNLRAAPNAHATGTDERVDAADSVATPARAGELVLVRDTGTTVVVRPPNDTPLDTRPTRPLPETGGRSLESWSRSYVRRAIVLDSLVGFAAMLAPATQSQTLAAHPSWLLTLALVGAVVWPLTVGLARGYEQARVGVGSDELRAVFRAAVALVLVGAFPAGLADHHALLKLAVVSAPLAAAGTLAVRYAGRRFLHSQQRRGVNVRRVVLAGSVSGVHELADRLTRETECGMRVVGVCVPAADVGSATQLGLTVLGHLHEVPQVVAASACDSVAVTSDDATRHNYLRRLAWSLEDVRVELLVDPGLVEVAGPRMHIRPLMGFPLLHVEQPRFSGSRRVMKRGLDLALTVTGLLAIAPLLIVIAVAIKLADGGPVLFRQQRVGRNGKEFTMLKFRSMVPDAEARKAELAELNETGGGLFKIRRDPRVTPLGQFLRSFSLDELPQ